MRTENLIPSEKRQESGAISPALLERVPAKWGIADEHDRPVALSRAGHVLHFGRTYKLWVAPFDSGETALEVHFTSRPSWVVPVPDAPKRYEKEKAAAVVAFQVKRQISWIWFRSWLTEIHSDNLEIEAVAKTPASTESRQAICPVVARRRWVGKVILLALFGAAVLGALELFFQQSFHAVSALVTTGTTPDPWQIPWLGFVLGAILTPAVAIGATIIHLVNRSHELERAFRQRWPRLET